ncbi:hypothetical protein BC938DRAFT_476988 [Jimgerdemannia flammicorona]|uniref:BTB domain-containing protein n=1 Tax=Jimgerdemannia flammicorona TaxID=994334 RepID=A0A433PCT9_9FUNG|nr:hypothetical protein BC938DRAFT_476988 [Jimgerdemannia flammicorona]
MLPKFRKNPIHHYPDGNVVLCVGHEHFRVHASIFRASSSFFDGFFSGNGKETVSHSVRCEHGDPKTDTGETDRKVIATVQLPGKNSKEVEMLLSTLYLHTEMEITWENVEPILKLADEYGFPRILAKCDQLLRRDIGNKPLEVLILADRYRLPKAFNASSALVLHDYAKISRRPEYKQLSLETRVELQAVRLRYLDGIEELSQQSAWANVKFNHPSCPANHFQHFNNQRSTGSLATLPLKQDFTGCQCCQQPDCTKAKIKRLKVALGMSDEPVIVEDKKYYLYIELAEPIKKKSPFSA